MEGLSVQTYQIGKKGNSPETNYSELEERVSALERQQTNICSEKNFDFLEEEYTDEYNTSVIFTQEGIVPKQYKNNLFMNFHNNDEYIDYDESTNISWNKKGLVYSADDITAAEAITFPLKVDNVTGLKLSSSYFTPTAISGTIEKELTTGSLFTATGVDKNGRLWVFTKPGYTNLSTEKILLTIYNKDMTVYKTHEYDNVFAKATQTIRFDGITVNFNDENVCFLTALTSLPDNYHMFNICIVNESDFKLVFESNYTQYEETRAYSILKPSVFIDNNIIFITSNNFSSAVRQSVSTKDIIIHYSSMTDFSVIYQRLLVSSAGNGIYSSCHKSNIFKKDDAYYYFSPKSNVITTGDISINNIRLYEFIVYDNKKNASMKEITITGTNEVLYFPRNSLNGMQYYNGYLYTFYNSVNSQKLIVKKFKVDIQKSNSCTLSKIKEAEILLSACTSVDDNYGFEYADGANFILEKGILNIFYSARKTDIDTTQCIKYLAIDEDLTVVTEEEKLYEASVNKIWYDCCKFNDCLTVIPKLNVDNNYKTDDTSSKSYLVKISQTTPTVQYYYLDNVNRIWTYIPLDSEITFDSQVSEIKIKMIMKSDTYKNSPVIKTLNVQTWNNDGSTSRQSVYYTKQIKNIKSNGKGIITSEQETNDGTIDWFITFDGGKTYTPIEPGDTFTYNNLTDFRIKIVLSVTDNAKILPIVHNFTLKTSYIALKSDIETIQINIMKTNFKIDTYTNAAKNGLLKMSIDTFASNNFIDSEKSDYIFYSAYGYVGGNYIQTKPEYIDTSSISLLLTIDEILQSSEDKILYYASLDNGTTFIEITPNAKTLITNNNSENSKLILRAVFYGNAKLNAWGWAWD